MLAHKQSGIKWSSREQGTPLAARRPGPGTIHPGDRVSQLLGRTSTRLPPCPWLEERRNVIITRAVDKQPQSSRVGPGPNRTAPRTLSPLEEGI